MLSGFSYSPSSSFSYLEQAENEREEEKDY